MAGGPRPHLPSHLAVDLQVEQQVAGRLVLLQGSADGRGHRHGGAVQVGRPHVDVVVALVEGRDGGGEGDLLVLVGDVDAGAVVRNADTAVGVVRGDSGLENGGEDVVGEGKVELVDGGVPEVEDGLGGAKDEPCDEDDEENDKDEGADDPRNGE